MGGIEVYIILGIISCSIAIITSIAFIDAWCDGEKGFAVVSFVLAVIFAVLTISCFAKTQEEKVKEEIVKENLNQGGRIMKANQLMIGDWVLYGDKSVKVLQLSENRKYDWVKPISLTYEILKKNGWKDAEFWCEYQEGNNTIQACLPDMRGRINGVEIEHFQCEYVHQYQHLLRLCGLDELADNFKV